MRRAFGSFERDLYMCITGSSVFRKRFFFSFFSFFVYYNSLMYMHSCHYTYPLYIYHLVAYIWGAVQEREVILVSCYYEENARNPVRAETRARSEKPDQQLGCGTVP